MQAKWCVACPWVNKHGLKHLFVQKGGVFASGLGAHRFQGLSNSQNVYIIQPVLHNTKGSASRLLGVIGRTLLPKLQHELLQVIAHVPRRYNLGSLPRDSREHQRLVRGRFLAGISLTGREAPTVMGRLASGMARPLPFHSLVLVYCRMVHLFHG